MKPPSNRPERRHQPRSAYGDLCGRPTTGKKLAEDRVDGPKWRLPRGKRFWDLTESERDAVNKLFGHEGLLKTILAAQEGAKAQPFIEDAAYWVKGCSSLGLLRFAVLLRTEQKHGSQWRLIDIKEAVGAKAPAVPVARLDRDHAGRVVTAAKVLAPGLGSRMVARSFLEKSVFIRELLPQDLKLEIATLTPDEAAKASRYLAMILGQAHAAQMPTGDRPTWLRELARGRNAQINAPTWLWRSVVASFRRQRSAQPSRTRAST